MGNALEFDASRFEIEMQRFLRGQIPPHQQLTIKIVNPNKD